MGIMETAQYKRKKHSPSLSVILSQTSLCFATKYFESRLSRLHATYYVHMVSMHMPSHEQRITVNGWRSEATGGLAIKNMVIGQLQRNFGVRKKA